MSPFGLKFSQMILHTETSKLMYNWSFLCVVLHKPTLLPSTFNGNITHLQTIVIVLKINQLIVTWDERSWCQNYIIIEFIGIMQHIWTMISPLKHQAGIKKKT